MSQQMTSMRTQTLGEYLNVARGYQIKKLTISRYVIA